MTVSLDDFAHLLEPKRRYWEKDLEPLHVTIDQHGEVHIIVPASTQRELDIMEARDVLRRITKLVKDIQGINERQRLDDQRKAERWFEDDRT